MKHWFYQYVRTFEQTDGILLKEEHSYKVSEECQNLSNDLNLDFMGKHLAEIIGLLHDVGRFEQYSKYKTFSDERSIDHAKLGLKIIKRNNLLQFYNPKTKKLILDAIRYHNRPVLPAHDTIFFSKLLRDADKLDILRVFINYYVNSDDSIGFNFPDTPGISKHVHKSITNRMFVKTKKVKNLNDFKLFCAAWVFDINFKPTLKKILERNYIDFLFDSINSDESITECKNIIYQTIRQKLFL